jgi:hypothetical protein
MAPLVGQSNRTSNLLAGGVWNLHSRIPLGSDSLILQPTGGIVEMFATAECPQFEGWRVAAPERKPVLLDSSGNRVRELPRTITFRVTIASHLKPADPDPMPIQWTRSASDLMLDLHFTVQIFRGMDMQEVNPVRTWMIGVPADESSDERVYRTTFNLPEMRPDDRIVLLVTDGSGDRLTKFHLEFL